MNDLVVESVLNGICDENMFFIHEKDKKNGVCIDPGHDFAPIEKFYNDNGYIVDAILLTHGHFDHALSAPNLVSKFSAKVYMTKEDAEIINIPNYSMSTWLGDSLQKKVSYDFPVEDNQIIEIDGIKFRCIKTPGHTKGSVCYYIEDAKILFSGDTLFYESHGRTDFYSGNLRELVKSICDKLFVLPDDVKVYPGHGVKTTIGYEKEHNIVRGE